MNEEDLGRELTITIENEVEKLYWQFDEYRAQEQNNDSVFSERDVFVFIMREFHDFCRHIYEDTESSYCPTCGACGEDFCCDPLMCKQVQQHIECHYGGDYVRNYDEVCKENYEYELRIKELEDELEDYRSRKNRTD